MENQEIENKDKKKKISRKFKTWFLVFILILAGFASYKLFFNFSSENQLAGEETSESPEVGSLAPDFVLEDTEDNEVILSSFRGKKPVLLVFWATWCGVCDEELPYLRAFYEVNKDDLELFGIVSGEAKWAIKEYIKKNEINFPILLDNRRKVWKKYLVRGTPYHFLIGLDGKIVSLIPGFASDYDLLMMFQSQIP